MSVLTRVLTALIAVALVAAAVIGVAEIVLAALDRPPWIVPREDWTAWLREQTWTVLVVRAILAGLLLLGLLLSLAALRRGRPSTLPLSSDTRGITVTASRRSVEKLLAGAARRTEGVSNSSARASRRRVRVQAHSRLRDPGDLQQRVTAAVQDRLRDVGLADTLRPDVRVSKGSR